MRTASEAGLHMDDSSNEEGWTELDSRYLWGFCV